MNSCGGTRLLLRAMRADDSADYDAFIARLDLDDLRFRFGKQADQVSRSELARLSRIDWGRDMALIAVMQRGERSWEIVGDARARADPFGARSEFAIVVRSDLQRLGLGRLLLEKVIRCCRARNVRLLYGLVGPSNAGMLGLARRLGFEVDHVPRGTIAVVSLELQPNADPHATFNLEQTDCDAVHARQGFAFREVCLSAEGEESSIA
jgi:acetyltransferase